ncbi:MAG: hypothetical protein AVDCRST_MAG88-4261, partial [uncultured Thermomicrobiales bacterium]
CTASCSAARQLSRVTSRIVIVAIAFSHLSRPGGGVRGLVRAPYFVLPQPPYSWPASAGGHGTAAPARRARDATARFDAFRLH